MYVQDDKGDGSVSLQCSDGVTHHFTASLSDFVHAPGGAVFLVSPPLACTDPGCGYRCQAVFPVAGTRSAQWLHVLHRLHVGKAASLAAAVASVAADVAANGGDPSPLIGGRH
jgi:hypothetical protein